MTKQTHNHKVASQHEFSNTKHGWFERCQCGAFRTQIPGAWGIDTSEWQIPTVR